MMSCCKSGLTFFFFNDPATTEIYTLSLHDALPISAEPPGPQVAQDLEAVAPGEHQVEDHDVRGLRGGEVVALLAGRSEEHTSELQSRQYLVCRLLLEKKNKDFGRKFIITASIPECR